MMEGKHQCMSCRGVRKREGKHDHQLPAGGIQGELRQSN